MNYREALQKSRIKKLVGVSIALPAAISTVISLLKMIYFRVSDGSKLGEAIATPFKKIVELIHGLTADYLQFFWDKSPTPNFLLLKDQENISFLVIYAAFFIGLAFYASGKRLSNMLRDINKQIEKQLIKESIQGKGSRTRLEIEGSAEVPSSSIFEQFHQLYLAPIVTAIIGGIFLKLLGF